MSWSHGFKQALTHRSIVPSYRLSIRSLSAVSIIFNIRSTGRSIAIDREGPTINGQRIIPLRWSITFGGFTVPIVGDMSGLFPAVRRGSFAELFCELDGHEERIACGQLRSINKRYNRFILEFVDLISALQTRYETTPAAGTAEEPDPFSLFYSAGIETTLTSNWTNHGAGFPTQLNLNDIRGFHKENGTYGVVRCQPSSGNEFILQWDSKTTTSGNAGFLTLSHTYQFSSTIYPTVYSPVNLTTSDKVFTAQYLQGWPADIFGKMLVSTTGTGSGLLTYPPAMNSGIGLSSSFYDQQDANTWKSYLKGAAPNLSAYDIGYVVNSPMTGGFRNLIEVFAKVGHWPVWRQNAISYRSCLLLNSSNITVAAKIYDTDIFELRTHELYSNDQQNTFFRSSIIYQNKAGLTSSITYTTGSTKAVSLPVQSNNERNVTGLYGYSPWTAAADRGSLANGDVQRLKEWDLFNYEKLVLVVKLKYATLCCGDVVAIHSGIFYGVNQGANDRTYNGTRFMVTGVDYSISSASCVLTLAAPFRQSAL